jgi:hypothetical protein
MAKATDTDGSLKRLGGGRWQTRDERFTIEPQSGTWVVVDGEQTDDLGLPLIRGPFGSLGAAKDAIASARDSAPAVSPLAARVAGHRDRPEPEPSTPVESGPVPIAKATSQAPDLKPPAEITRKPPVEPKPKPKRPATPEPPPEPKWLRDLAPARRSQAHALMNALTASGSTDAEGIARRDIVGKVPATAAYAIGRALAALGPDAAPSDVARLVASGADDGLGVRWRLVDADDRPITLDLPARVRK